MDAYKTILGHYYSYISVENSTFILHSCQTSVVNCLKNINQPCIRAISNICEYNEKSECILPRVCTKCNALKLSDFRVLQKYFDSNGSVDLDENLICFSDRVPCLSETIYKSMNFKSDNKSLDWIVEKVLVMCIFTERHSHNSELLSDMVSLFSGKIFGKNSNYNLQNFIYEFNHTQDLIPVKSELGIMLTQAIDKLNIYKTENNGFFSVTTVSMLIACKIKKFCLKNQSNLEYT